MAGMTDSLRILITANGAQAEREFAKVGAASRRSLGQAETSAQQYSRVMTSAGIAMTTFGVVALAGLAKAAQAAEVQTRSQLELQNTIANIPELAGASTDAFLEQASALQQTTKYGDEATVSMQAMLGTFHLTEQQILQLAPLVQDYASKFNVDLVDAAKQVGKAVSGQRGALQRNGVLLDENAYAADRFSAVMDALRDNAGGFAAQEGRTLSGQLARLQNNLGDIAETVGTGAAEAFSSLAAPVEGLSNTLKSLNPEAQQLIGKVATFGAIGLTAAGALTFLGGQALKLNGLFTTLGNTSLVLRARLALLAVGGAGFAAVAVGAVAAGAAIASYTRSKEQAARVQNFVDALKAEAEGLEGATNAALANVLATDGQIKNYQDLGISADTIVGAIRGERDAWAELTQARSEAESVIGDNDLHNPEIEQQAAAVTNLVRAVENQRNAYRDANSAQRDFEDALAATGEAAGMTEEAIAALSQEIDDYLAGAFDVPSAQRDLRDSFQSLFEALAPGASSVDEINQALQDTVESTAAVVNAQIQQNASQEEVNATLAASRQRLMDTFRAGLISQQQFIEYSRVLDGIKPIVRTAVSTPGADESIEKLRTVRTTVDGIPRDIQVRVSVDQGALAADVAGAAAQLRSLRGFVESSTFSPTTTARDRVGTITTIGPAGRSGPSSRAPGGANSGDLAVADVILDGEKVGEVVAARNRKYNLARGAA